MEQQLFKSLILVAILFTISQVTVAKYLNYNLRPRLFSTYAKRGVNGIDFLDDTASNYIDENNDEHVYRHVKLAKKKKIEISEGPIVLSAGESIQLNCSSFGRPVPSVYWVRDDEMLAIKAMRNRQSSMMYTKVATDDNLGTMNSKYVIDCASKRDEGEYYCVSISNNEMHIASLNVTVNSNTLKYCEIDKQPVITKHIKFLFANQGATVSLPCGVKNAPISNIQWYTADGGNPLSKSHIQMEEGELVIKNIDWTDMNVYTCTIEMDYKTIDKVSTFLYPLAT